MHLCVDFIAIFAALKYYLMITYLLQVSGEDEIQQLQKALLDYLDENTETDASLVVNFSFLELNIYKYHLIKRLFIKSLVSETSLLWLHTTHS